MAQVISMKVVGQSIFDDGSGAQLELTVEALFIDAPNLYFAHENVNAFFSLTATPFQIRNALRNALIDRADTEHGLTVTGGDCIIPEFQRGLL